MPPLPADSIHARACKLKCEKILTRPETADLPLFQRTKQCGGDGVRRQRLYRSWTTGYFSVNARNSPQIEGSFDVFCVFLCKLLAFYAEIT